MFAIQSHRNEAACIARFHSGRSKVRALKAASILDAQNAEAVLQGAFCLQRFKKPLFNLKFVVRVRDNIVDTEVLALPIDPAATGQSQRAQSAGANDRRQGQHNLGAVARGLRSFVDTILRHMWECHSAKVVSGEFEFVYSPGAGEVPGPNNALLYGIPSLTFEGSSPPTMVQVGGFRKLDKDSDAQHQQSGAFLPPISTAAEPSRPRRPQRPVNSPVRSNQRLALSPRVRAAARRSAASSPKMSERAFHAEQRRLVKTGQLKAHGAGATPNPLADSDSDHGDDTDGGGSDSDSFHDDRHRGTPSHTSPRQRNSTIQTAATSSPAEASSRATTAQSLASASDSSATMRESQLLLDQQSLARGRTRPESAPLSTTQSNRGTPMQTPGLPSRRKAGNRRQLALSRHRNLPEIASVTHKGDSLAFGSAGMASRSMITQFRAQLVAHRSVVDELARIVQGVDARHEPLEVSMSQLSEQVDGLRRFVENFESTFEDLHSSFLASDGFLRSEVAQLRKQLAQSDKARQVTENSVRQTQEAMSRDLQTLRRMVEGQILPQLTAVDDRTARLQKAHDEHVASYQTHAQQCNADRATLGSRNSEIHSETAARLTALEETAAGTTATLAETDSVAREALTKVDGLGRRKYGLGWDRGLGHATSKGDSGSRKKWQRPTAKVE